MLVAPEAAPIDTPRDAPLGMVVVLDDDGCGFPTGVAENVDRAVAAVDELDGVANAPVAGDPSVGAVGVGDASDGVVSVEVIGEVIGAGGVAGVDDVDTVDAPRGLNGRGAGGLGAGAAKHGA